MILLSNAIVKKMSVDNASNRVYVGPSRVKGQLLDYRTSGSKMYKLGESNRRTNELIFGCLRFLFLQYAWWEPISRFSCSAKVA